MNPRPPKSRAKSPVDRNRSARQKRTGTPAVAAFSDEPPQSSTLTDYDREHLVLYIRLLDAAEDGAEWTEVARILFGLDPKRDGARAQIVYQSHLARARWMAEHGYHDLLRSALH